MHCGKVFHFSQWSSMAAENPWKSHILCFFVRYLSQILQISITDIYRWVSHIFPWKTHETSSSQIGVNHQPRQAWESQWRPVVCETLPGPMSWNQFPGQKKQVQLSPQKMCSVFIVSRYLVWQFRCGSRHFWCLYLVTGGTEYRIRAHFKCNQHPPAEFQDVL